MPVPYPTPPDSSVKVLECLKGHWGSHSREHASTPEVQATLRLHQQTLSSLPDGGHLKDRAVWA